MIDVLIEPLILHHTRQNLNFLQYITKLVLNWFVNNRVIVNYSDRDIIIDSKLTMGLHIRVHWKMIFPFHV